jgi:hypothetical protein
MKAILKGRSSAVEAAAIAAALGLPLYLHLANLLRSIVP